MTAITCDFRKRIVFIGQGVEYVFAELAARARERECEVFECDFLNTEWRSSLGTLEPGSFTLVSSHHPYLCSDSYPIQHGVAAVIPTLADFISEYRPARILYVPHDLGYPIKSDEVGSLKYVDCLLMPSDAFWWLGSFARVVNCGWVKWLPDKQPQAPEFDIAFIPSEIPALLRKTDSEIDEIFGPVLARKPPIRLPDFPGIERIVTLAKRYGATVVDTSVSVADLIMNARAVVSSGESSVLLEAACAGRPTLCIKDYTRPAASQEQFVRQIPGARLDNARSGLAWIDAIRDGTASFEGPPARVGPFDLDLFWEIVNQAEIEA